MITSAVSIQRTAGEETALVTLKLSPMRLRIRPAADFASLIPFLERGLGGAFTVSAWVTRIILMAKKYRFVAIYLFRSSPHANDFISSKKAPEKTIRVWFLFSSSSAASREGALTF